MLLTISFCTEAAEIERPTLSTRTYPGIVRSHVCWGNMYAFPSMFRIQASRDVADEVAHNGFGVPADVCLNPTGEVHRFAEADG